MTDANAWLYRDYQPYAANGTEQRELDRATVPLELQAIQADPGERERISKLIKTTNESAGNEEKVDVDRERNHRLSI